MISPFSETRAPYAYGPNKYEYALRKIDCYKFYMVAGCISICRGWLIEKLFAGTQWSLIDPIRTFSLRNGFLL